MNKNSIWEGTKSRACLPTFGAESFVFQFPIQKTITIKKHRTIILYFFMGVKFGRSY